MRAHRPILCALLTLWAWPLAARPVVKIVAKVADHIITNVDLDDAVKLVVANMSPQELASPEGQQKLAQARENVLNHLVEMRLVIQAAEDGPPGYKAAVAQGKGGHNPYLPESSEIETQMEKLFDQTRQSFPDEESFETELLKEHETVPEFRNELRQRVKDQMTFQRMLKMKESEMQSSMQVSDEAARAFYDAHPEIFAKGAQVELRHILFAKGDEAQAKAVLAKLRKAKNLETAFIAAARKYSIDTPTKDQGGLLGWVERGQSWPELEKLAFATPDGHLAGPVKTDAGWHILLVEGHKKSQTLSFDQVKADARNRVYQKRLKDRTDEWIQHLKSKYYVEENTQALQP